MKARVRLSLGLTTVAFLLACHDANTNLVSDPAASQLDAGHDAAVSGKPDAGKPTRDAGPGLAVMCGGHVCACSNGADDDGDGLIDGLDPECTGPSDDDEHSFATGAPVSAAACRDCFWDTNAGSGDDGCRYPKECLEGTAPPGKGNCGSCDVSSACVSACLPRTPNGCDCFGCCQVTQSDGSVVHVELSDACALDKLADEKACPRCVQSTTCLNTCGRCELCPGRRPDQLPKDCAASVAPGAPSYQCEGGSTVCTASSECSAATPYCQLGCCLPFVP